MKWGTEVERVFSLVAELLRKHEPKWCYDLTGARSGTERRGMLNTLQDAIWACHWQCVRFLRLFSGAMIGDCRSW